MAGSDIASGSGKRGPRQPRDLTTVLQQHLKTATALETAFPSTVKSYNQSLEVYQRQWSQRIPESGPFTLNDLNWVTAKKNGSVTTKAYMSVWRLADLVSGERARGHCNLHRDVKALWETQHILDWMAAPTRAPEPDILRIRFSCDYNRNEAVDENPRTRMDVHRQQAAAKAEGKREGVPRVSKKDRGVAKSQVRALSSCALPQKRAYGHTSREKLAPPPCVALTGPQEMPTLSQLSFV